MLKRVELASLASDVVVAARSETDEATVLLHGFLGQSSEYGVTLYASRDADAWSEIPQRAIVAVFEDSEDGAVLLLVRCEAEIRTVVRNKLVDLTEPVMSSDRFIPKCTKKYIGGRWCRQNTGELMQKYQQTCIVRSGSGLKVETTDGEEVVGSCRQHKWWDVAGL